MRSKINISIPEPCHENWQSMSPTEKGRFCASCQKNVIDFTHATDSEIVKALKQNDNLCGRFASTQLDRDLVERKEKSSIWIAASTAVLSFLSIGNSEIFAQEKPKTEQTDMKTVSENDAIPKIKNKEITINGTVSEGELPLPGVYINIKGTSSETTSDLDGNFSIKAKHGDILTLSFIGMKSEEVIIKNDTKINIKMKGQILGETFILTGGIKRRTFFGRTFHKIGNWFR